VRAVALLAAFALLSLASSEEGNPLTDAHVKLKHQAAGDTAAHETSADREESAVPSAESKPELGEASDAAVRSKAADAGVAAAADVPQPDHRSDPADGHDDHRDSGRVSDEQGQTTDTPKASTDDTEKTDDERDSTEDLGDSVGKVSVNEALHEAKVALGESSKAPSDVNSPKIPCKDKACKDKHKAEAQKAMNKDASKAAESAARRLGEDASKAKAAKVKKQKAAARAPVKGEAYIPLSPTIPKLTVLDVSAVKGLLQVQTPAKRQFHVNKFADVSGTLGGAALFGGNAHIVNKKSKDEFHFSNSHGQIGAMAFATHYPHYNKASVISSGTKASKEGTSFVPRVVTTFTKKGDVGVGVSGPASRLHVQGTGNTRLINANHWADLSGCASGIGLMAGNAYVTTESNEARFRYANSHSSMGAIGFAVNYPDWNKASIVSSGTKAAQGKKAFKPKVVSTFTHDGLVGMGTTHPKSRLDVHSHARQFSVNDWIDVSSQGSAGFVGMNAHLVLKGSKRFFAFSNTAKTFGAIGVATNFPVINQLSIVSSKTSSSSKGTLFKPQAIATFTNSGNVGFGTDAPKAKLDVRHKTSRQISANKYADVSANDQLQGFFGGNGYAVGRQFAFSNTHGVVGAVGLATHYPSPGHASIISSANQQPKADAPFKPTILANFKPDGSLYIPKGVVVGGDITVKGRFLNGDSTREYDFMAAHEALVQENMDLRTRLTKMEAMMATLTMARA